MSYIGNPIISTDFPKDTFSGTGSATAFTMSIAPASVNAVMVIVSGVTQDPSTYTISGTTLTFSAAPPSGTNNISVRHLGVAGIPNVPADASVTTAKLATQTSVPFATSSLGAGNASIMKNRIINGAMVIDQRNAGASVTPTVSPTYTLDRWYYNLTQASKVSIQQNAGSVTPPVGFVNYLGITSLSSYSVLTGDYFMISQSIEGFNTADLVWGTANAKAVTLSFQVYSSLTGTFGGALENNAGNRCYPFSYTVSSPNTWTTISLTISGDTTGTWLTNNSTGISVRFGLGCGSTFGSGTAGAWSSTRSFQPTGTTSVVGTSGATFYITGVQLEVGSSATGFEYRQYQQELALCQRYFQISNSFISVGYNSGSGINIQFSYPTTMRASATVGQTGVLAITDAVAADYTQSSTNIALNGGRVSVNGAQISCLNFSGLTNYRPYFSKMDSGGSITFSAEL